MAEFMKNLYENEEKNRGKDFFKLVTKLNVEKYALHSMNVKEQSTVLALKSLYTITRLSLTELVNIFIANYNLHEMMKTNDAQIRVEPTIGSVEDRLRNDFRDVKSVF